MKRIEIVGAPYVGKTTLYRNLCSHKTDHSSWTTETEMYEAARKKVGYIDDFKKRLFRRLMPKTELGKKYRYFGFSDMDSLDSRYLNNYRHILDLCFLRTDNIKDIKLALRVYHKMMERIAKLYFYNGSKSNGKVLLVQEFMLHWHLVLIKHIQSYPLDYPTWIQDEGLTPAGLIFCHADEEQLLKRMERRMKVKTLNKNHQHKTKQAIFEDIKSKQHSFEILASYLRENNVPVLNVDTGMDLDENREKVLNFIDSINQKKLEMTHSTPGQPGVLTTQQRLEPLVKNSVFLFFLLACYGTLKIKGTEGYSPNSGNQIQYQKH